MIVISNTSPINYLVLIDCIDVLPRLYDRVYIPGAVRTELTSQATPLLVRNWTAQSPEWLECRFDAPAAVLPKLDIGEAEAIALAMEMKADLILLDERRARNAAIENGLAVIGTLGIFAQASDKDLIDLQDAISRLDTTSFRMSDALRPAILNRAQ